MNVSDDDIKIILLGETGVGKTNLINIYFNQEFNENPDSTIASYCLQDHIKHVNKIYTYTMWDTAGQEKYRAITNQFIRDAKIILLVYAIDNRKSFQGIDVWMNFVKENKGDDKYIIGLVANKSDLFETQEVTDEEGKQLAKKYGSEFLLTSALETPKSFQNFVVKLIINYINMMEGVGNSGNKNIKINEEKDATLQKKKKCC